MKHIKIITIIFMSTLVSLIGGCSKDSDDSIIPGYWSPGEFRPKGIAGHKAYSFANLTGSGPISCSSNVTPPRWPDQWTDTDHCKVDPANPSAPCYQHGDGQCRVIYGSWPTGTSYTSSIILSGFALNDSHNLSPSNNTLHFIMKVIGVLNEWQIYLILDGVEYRGSVPNTDVTIVDEDTRLYTEPACSTSSTPACAKTYEASSDTLKIKTITFNTDVTLSTCTVPTLTPCTVQTVNIQSGDYIVAQVYGI